MRNLKVPTSSSLEHFSLYSSNKCYSPYPINISYIYIYILNFPNHIQIELTIGPNLKGWDLSIYILYFNIFLIP